MGKRGFAVTATPKPRGTGAALKGGGTRAAHTTRDSGGAFWRAAGAGGHKRKGRMGMGTRRGFPARRTGARAPPERANSCRPWPDRTKAAPSEQNSNPMWA